MTPRRLPLLLAFAALSACATPPAPVPDAPPPADFHLILGELALARDRRDVATVQYAQAAFRLEEAGVARRATLIALHAGDRIAAQRAADRWEALAGEDLEAAQYQAVLHARAGRTAAALDYLLRLVHADSAAAGADLQLVTTLLAGEPNVWRSADLMASVAAAHPAHAEGWYGAALLALEADRPARAERFAANALALAPKLPDARFLRARALLLDAPAMADEALASLAAFRDARDPALRFRYAGLLVLADQAGEADALYEDILLAAPDQHDARMARALLAMDDGRFDDAEAGLHALLGRHGRVQDALYYLGVLAEKRGRPEDAIDWYARVAPGMQRWLDAQLGIGRILIDLHGPAAVQELFADMRALWPEHARLLALNEAALLVAAGHPALALPLLETHAAGADDLERSEFDWQLARASAKVGDTARAEAIYRCMLKADPGNPALQNALGGLLLEEPGELPEAQILLEAAHAAAPANPAMLDSLGWLRYRQARHGEARRLLEESWRRQSAAVTGLHLLAVLVALGDTGAAAALRTELDARFPGVLADEESP